MVIVVQSNSVSKVIMGHGQTTWPADQSEAMAASMQPTPSTLVRYKQVESIQGRKERNEIIVSLHLVMCYVYTSDTLSTVVNALIQIEHPTR